MLQIRTLRRISLLETGKKIIYIVVFPPWNSGHALQAECDVPVPGIPVPGNCSLFLMVSEPVSEKFGTEKSLGIGIEKIWYRKKSRNRYRSDFGSRHTLLTNCDYNAFSRQTNYL